MSFLVAFVAKFKQQNTNATDQVANDFIQRFDGLIRKFEARPVVMFFGKRLQMRPSDRFQFGRGLAWDDVEGGFQPAFRYSDFERSHFLGRLAANRARGRSGQKPPHFPEPDR